MVDTLLPVYALLATVTLAVTICVMLWRDRQARREYDMLQGSLEESREATRAQQTRVTDSARTANHLEEQLKAELNSRARVQTDLTGLQRHLQDKDQLLLKTQEILKEREDALVALQGSQKQTAQRLQESQTRMRNLLDYQKEFRKKNKLLERQVVTLQQSQQEVERSYQEVVASQARNQGLLSRLGLDFSAVKASPLSPARRLETREILSELRVELDATACGVVQADRGLPMLACGDLPMSQRLGALSTLVDRMSPALCASLGDAPERFELSTAYVGYHLFGMPGDGQYLAIGGPSDVPHRVMLHALLRLSGPIPPQAAAAPEKLVLMPAEQCRVQALERVASSWAQRWQALTVAIIREEGQILAATGEEVLPVLVTLYSQVREISARLSRDEIPLDQLWVSSSSQDGASVYVRFLFDDVDSPAVIVRSARTLPSIALDELCSTVRWKVQRRPPRGSQTPAQVAVA